MANTQTLTYGNQGVGGYIDVSQFGIKPGAPFAHVDPKSGCWVCTTVPEDCMIPVHSKMGAIAYDKAGQAKPFLCTPDKIACGCGSTVVGSVPPEGEEFATLQQVEDCINEWAAGQIEAKTAEETEEDPEE